MLEHNDADATHGRGGNEKEPDPLPVRIENLKKTIQRLLAKPRRTKGEFTLLHEYEGGLVELEARLENERGAD